MFVNRQYSFKYGVKSDISNMALCSKTNQALNYNHILVTREVHSAVYIPLHNPTKSPPLITHISMAPSRKKPSKKKAKNAASIRDFNFIVGHTPTGRFTVKKETISKLATKVQKPLSTIQIAKQASAPNTTPPAPKVSVVNVKKPRKTKVSNQNNTSKLDVNHGLHRTSQTSSKTGCCLSMNSWKQLMILKLRALPQSVSPARRSREQLDVPTALEVLCIANRALPIDTKPIHIIVL